MRSNTKLLILTSVTIIIFGFGLLWFGLGQTAQQEALPSPIPFFENTPIATSSATYQVADEQVLVSKVVDGDTIVVNSETTVRLIGIDTPETVDPRRPVGCFGKEASEETKSLLTGRNVVLKKDISDKDKYGRLLRYIFLPLDNGQTLFVNDYLVREGFAKVLTYPPDVKFNEQLRQAEKEAKENVRGLWGRCK